MKKLTLSLVTSALLTTSSIASDSIVSFDAGVWYMMWNQSDNVGDNSKVSDNVNYADTSYDIDPTVAAVINLKANVAGISGNLEYYNGAISSDSGEDVSGYSLGAYTNDLLKIVGVQIKATNANFERGTYKYDYKPASTGVDGVAKFKTKTSITEFNIFPYNDYVGVGYRTYKYELPAQFAVVNNGVVTGVGLLDTKLDGKFIQLTVDNKKQTDAVADFKGFIYSATVGMGSFDTDSVSQAGMDPFLTDMDATFIEAILGYTYNNKDENGFGLGFSAGYRYNQITTEDPNLDQSLKITTSFDTTFHGPFVNMSLSF